MTNDTASTPARTFSRVYDHAVEQLRAIKAIGLIQSADSNLEDCHMTVADHVSRLAGDALDALDELWERHGEDFEPKQAPAPVAGEEWSPKDLGEELKAIGARMTALPEQGVRELLDLALTLVAAHNPGGTRDRLTLAEIDALIGRGLGPRYVHAAWWLKSQGGVDILPAATDAPTEGSEA